MHRVLILVALTVLVVSARADIFDISASERGWVCAGGPFCPGNNGAFPGNNYSAGFAQNVGMVRNWFEFSIPTLTGGSLVSAMLNLYEPSMLNNGDLGDGHRGGPLTFAVYGLGAQPVVFTDVNSSNPFFGTVGTSSADNGTTVSITLNAAALAAIAADQGSNIFIGGIDSGENASSGVFLVGDFLNTEFQNNTVLSLTTVPASVPEPSSLPLLACAAVLISWRRKLRG